MAWERSEITAVSEITAILDSATNGIIVMNTETEIVLCNQTAARLLNLSATNAIGQKFTGILSNSCLERVLQTSTPCSEHMLINEHLVIANYSPYYKESQLVGVMVIFQDGRELQALQAKLRDTQTELTSLEKIFEQAYDGVVVTDTQGIVTRITNAYCRFLQIDPKEAVGRHVTEIIPNSRMQIVASTGKAEIGEAMNLHGKEAVVMRLPLREGDRIIGAVGKVMFRDVQELRTLMEKLHLLEHKLKFYEKELQRYQRHRYTFGNIIGHSQSLVKAKELAEKAAQTKSTVLLRGESGTGKEVFAHAIHAAGSRSGNPFVRVNCGAIPAELLEAELFGYAEGAFTGAKKGGKPGKFELANGGTIFLDEVGDLPLSMQAKVLRVLQEKEIERVGSNLLQQLDIRVIAATNRHLEEMVAAGEFRQDLYYRLNVFPITIPPLRERREDILLLSKYILDQFNRELGLTETALDPLVLELFLTYSWPGNVRELQNVLERAVNVAEGNKIMLEDLPLYLREPMRRQGNGQLNSLAQELAEAEKEAIIRTLKAAGGNKVKAAEILGIHRTNLYRKMEKYGLLDNR